MSAHKQKSKKITAKPITNVDANREPMSLDSLCDATPRSLAEIETAEQELMDKRWYYLHFSPQADVKMIEQRHPGFLKCMQGNAQRAVDKYGKENLEVRTEYERGVLNGKLSAISWVLGEDWDYRDIPVW